MRSAHNTRLTIQQRLAEGHDGGRPTHQHRERRHLDLLLLPHKPLGRLLLALLDLAVREHDPQVEGVHGALEDVEHALRGREAVARLPRRPAVHVVDGAVERIRGPDRRVQPPARHAVRAEKHVPEVPQGQRQREHEPGQHDPVRRVDVARGAGAAGLGGRFRGGDRIGGRGGRSRFRGRGGRSRRRGSDGGLREVRWVMAR